VLQPAATVQSVRRFFLFRGWWTTTSRNTTVRLALTNTIAVYTAALLLVITMSTSAAESGRYGARKKYTVEMAVLRHLTASSVALLQAQVDLCAYDARRAGQTD
jgi:hypothetical protein